MLTLIDPPIDPIFTLAEAKAFLRVDHDDDNDLITTLIAAAASRLDGRDGVLGRCLRPQRWRFDADAFPATGDTLRLPLPPTVTVEQIQYYDTAGTLTTWAGTLWREVTGGWSGAGVIPVTGQDWPTTEAVPDTVQVTFIAGYSDATSPAAAPDAIPEAIRLAARMMVGDWYENRLNTVIGATGYELPYAAVVLLAPFRILPIA